jgi:hypothetical protein
MNIKDMRPQVMIVSAGANLTLVVDDGQELGSYNTQAHWLVPNNVLFLSYTRQGANNSIYYLLGEYISLYNNTISS